MTAGPSPNSPSGSMQDWVEQEIAATVAAYQHRADVSTAWKTPLVAYANAHDALFPRLKEIIRPTHATPVELLDSAQSVITYFLPFDEGVPRSNRPGRYASDDWAVAYVETNALIRTVNEQLAEGLRARGHASVVLPPTHNFDKQSLLSDWSHKHVAYIAGLGQFGLHQMLITAAGSCGRLGSLVTNARLESTPRRTQPACLYTYDQSCTACVKLCPSGALTEHGFDRQACYSLCLENADKNRQHGLADVCGKCLSVVPCSFIDPVARKLAKAQAGSSSPP
jgi:epoxyqueuosine reductase QueG